MILNNAQAQAILRALAELNNVGAQIVGAIKLENALVSFWADEGLSVALTPSFSKQEHYTNQAQFAAAYGADHD